MPVLFAQATYQAGKIVAIGDSSIPDDGSGDTGDILYDGYITDASGNHQKLLMNAIIWLTTPALGSETFNESQTQLVVSPNPIQNHQLNIYYHSLNVTKTTFVIYDSLGRLIKQVLVNAALQSIDCSELSAGVYFGKAVSDNNSTLVKFVIE